MFQKHLKCVLNVLEVKPLRDVFVRSASSSNCASSEGSYRHQVSATPLRHITFGQCLAASADQWPDRPAVISRVDGKRLTYSELLEQSDRLAAALMASGLQKGDRLGIWMPNYSEWLVAMTAASRLGLISVAINFLYRHNEIEYAIKKVGIKALVAPGSRQDPRYYKILADVIPELQNSVPGNLKSKKFEDLTAVILVDDDGSPGTVSYGKLMSMPTTQEINSIAGICDTLDPDSGCNIQYTSGTTGQPKAALLSHHSLVNNGYVIGRRNELDRRHQTISVQVPLFHVFGVVVTVSSAVQHGATLVLPSPFYSPSANLEALVKEKCTTVHGTPTMYVDLVNEFKSRGMTDSLKTDTAVTGGSPVTPQLVQDVANVLNIRRVKSIFGMTETSAVNFQSVPEEDPQRPLHYIGQLHDHLEAKIVDVNGKTIPFGQPGELLIRGYSVMMGYWGDEAKTKETFDDGGWLKTGDRVTMYEDGYGQIVGRLKDIIIRGGENIAPKEIEDVMSSHPDVLECQVFGISDDRLGEDICAAVRMKEGTTFSEDSLRKHVLNTLAKYKVPKVIKRIEEYPKTASGKVQKFKLKELFEAGKL